MIFGFASKAYKPLGDREGEAETGIRDSNGFASRVRFQALILFLAMLASGATGFMLASQKGRFMTSHSEHTLQLQRETPLPIPRI